MPDLTPLTALGQTAPMVLTRGALTVTEHPALALASLALGRGAVAPCPFGVQLPEPGLWAAGQGIAAFWTGPNQWMIEAEGRAEEDFARDLTVHAPGCSVTEQTDGWVCYEITSSKGATPILNLLEKLVNIDVASFGPGRATRTGLEHMSVFVIRRAEDRLAILGMRSSAASLWHAIGTAAGRLEEVLE
ncbi:sarcosine oxidase subunit gamma [Paenirhodobacter populi]|nr:sarcosine oxidase subunit gamma [Sinirhodobacter populi]